MKKKLLAMLLVVAMVAALAVGLTACNKDKNDGTLKPVAKDEIKIGFLFLHDKTSTYDLNFIEAAEAVQAALGLRNDQVIMKMGVDESEECYEEAADLVDQGCNVIFADSFAHEDFMIKAAKEFPNVQFCHATGVKAHTENLPNYHNAFASIYEGRYLAGIVAGLKLNAMAVANNTAVEGKATGADAKIGYVGAKPYAEVISGYTSFFLGVKSVCPAVTMEVTYTGEWYDPTAEQEAAEALIARGSKLISQHADSMGAPNACETNNIPNVSYNGSTVTDCPNTYLVSSKINWAPYFTYMINQVIAGKAIDADWCGTLENGSVALTALNTTAGVVPSTAQAAIDEAKAKLIAGEIHVFDTDNFTVNNQKLTTYLADVNFDAAYTADTEVIVDGVLYESKFRSAPYFYMIIDGITVLSAS